MNQNHKISAAAKAQWASGKMDFLRGDPNSLLKKNPQEYDRIHKLIKKMWGQPELCENCGIKDGRFDWANKDGKYLLDRETWKRLCRPCHNRLDMQKRLKRTAEQTQSLDALLKEQD